MHADHYSTSTLADAGGPDWFVARRRAAMAAFEGVDRPSTEDEVWRYSPIDSLDLDAFPPAAPASAAGGQVANLSSAPGRRAGLVIVANGTLISVELSGDAVDAGVTVGRLTEHRDAEALLDQVPVEDDAFSLLNSACATDPVVVDLPPGAVLDAPIVVVHQAVGGPGTSFPRTVVRAGAASQADVVEVGTSGAGRRLVVPVTTIAVGDGARFGYVSLELHGAETWQLARQVVSVGQQATYRSGAVVLGGDYSRTHVDCSLDGRGATAELTAAYLASGTQTLDFRTFQHHRAPDTTSDLLFKGAVDDEARSIYTGLIHVTGEARGTNAFQTNRNIKLSEQAWAESVPNLEIETNDVRCSHASTVGPIDDEQRFYLESRGVPTDEAERLIVNGFFAEALTRVPVAGVRRAAAEWIEAKIDGGDEPVPAAVTEEVADV